MILQKTLMIILFILIPMPYTIADDQKDASVSDSIRIERLAGLCELWGVVKYFHPYLAYKDIDWAEALIKTIPKVNKAVTPEEYRRAIDYMLSFLQDPNTYVRDQENQFTPARISDVEAYQPYMFWTDDSIAVVVANNYGSFTFHPDLYILMEDIVARAVAARGIVIDARRLDVPTQKANYSSYMILDYLLMIYLPDLLKGPLSYPSSRFIEYPRDPAAITGFRHYTFIRNFNYRSGYEIAGRLQGEVPPKLVFVINEGSDVLQPLIVALQESNQAEILYEGSFWKELGVETYPVRLPDDLVVEVRLNELVRSDGTAATHPDLVIPYVTDTTLLASPPITMAIEVINGTRETPPAMAEFLPARTFFRPDSSYAEENLPQFERRILAMSSLWNALKYFYPYFEQIEPSPHQFLTDFILEMEQADTRRAYVTTLARMAARLNDSNAEVESEALDQFFGEYRPIFEVTYVQGKTVVNRIVDCSDKSTLGLDPGDIILAIDNEAVDARRTRLSQYLSGSTTRAVEIKINEYLLNGENGSNARLVVEKTNGDTVEVTAKRSAWSPDFPETRCGVEILDDKIGYVHLARVSVEYFIDNILDDQQSTRALILDMRRYGIGPDWAFLKYLVNEEVVGSRARVLGRQSPDCLESSWTLSNGKLAPAIDGKYYDKSLVVLIDETTINDGEWYCMFLKAGTDATFIGTTTNGTVGGDSQVSLPGGVRMKYSRQIVEYPDGRPVQSVGIQPDILVEPTIEGIRQGRDEILEAALEFLKNELKK